MKLYNWNLNFIMHWTGLMNPAHCSEPIELSNRFLKFQSRLKSKNFKNTHSVGLVFTVGLCSELFKNLRIHQHFLKTKSIEFASRSEILGISKWDRKFVSRTVSHLEAVSISRNVSFFFVANALKLNSDFLCKKSQFRKSIQTWNFLAKFQIHKRNQVIGLQRVTALSPQSLIPKRAS